jgi:DNA replication protein DnaC
MNNETMDKLRRLKLFGMAKALDEQARTPTASGLGFDERFGMVVDQEEIDRQNRSTARRLRVAKLREPAIVEDINWRHPRQLDRPQMLALATCEWLKRHQHVVFVGKTGLGKTWLACALAHRACLLGHTVRFVRIPRLVGELAAARAAGTYGAVLERLARTRLLVFDDWGQQLNEQERRDFREVIEDRDGRGSVVITTQLPIERWHEAIGDPTLADAIVDRIVNKAHRIALDGPSMRELRRQVDDETAQQQGEHQV